MARYVVQEGGTTRFEMRLSEAEKAALKARAARFGMTQAEFIRAVIIGSDRPDGRKDNGRGRRKPAVGERAA